MDAVLSDGVGDRPQHAQRRQAHDQPHGAEQHLAHHVDHGGDRLGRFADQGETGAEDDGEEQHLQHVVARQRVERGGWDDVEDEGADAAALQLVGVVRIRAHRMRIQRRRVDVHAGAGVDHVGQQQPDGERHRGHHLEIQQRLAADTPDLLQIPGPGDAVHHDAEHDRRHDHGNELEESVTEELEADREARREHAKHDAQHQPDDNLHEQRLIKRRTDRGGRRRAHGEALSHRRVVHAMDRARNGLATGVPSYMARWVCAVPAR